MTYKTNNIKEDCLLDELQKSFTFWSKLLHGWVQEPHWRAVVCYFSNIFQYFYDLFKIILGWRSLHYPRYRFGFGVLWFFIYISPPPLQSPFLRKSGNFGAVGRFWCSSHLKNCKMPNVSSDLINHPEVDFYVGREVDEFYIFEKKIICPFLPRLKLFVNFDSGQCTKCTQNKCTRTRKNGQFKLDDGNIQFTNHPTTHVFGCVRNNTNEATPSYTVHLIKRWCSKYISWAKLRSSLIFMKINKEIF